MYRLAAGTFKIALASLITGAGLSFFDLSAQQVLADLGMTQDRMVELAEHAAAWALPNVLLGSMIIVPVWIVVSLLRPPRG